jgi:hypothetical protein
VTGSRATARIRTLFAAIALAALVLSPLSAKKKNRGDDSDDVPVICHDVAIDGKYALLAQTSGVAIWDVSDPVRPRTAAGVTVPATVLGVDTRLPMVYLAAGTHGLYVVRWDGEGEPAILARHDTPGSVNGVRLLDHYALLSDERYGVRVVDVEHPDRPLQKALVSTRDRVHSIALDGRLLATAEGRVGVRLFDVSQPERPIELHLLRDIDDARDVAWAGPGRLLVAGGDTGLLVFELDGDGEPRRVGAAAVDGPARFVGGDDGLAVVTNGTPALQVFGVDASGETHALHAFRVHRSAPAGRVHVIGTRAFVALDRAGISIVDLGDPLTPEVLLPKDRRLRIDWPGREAADESR